MVYVPRSVWCAVAVGVLIPAFFFISQYLDERKEPYVTLTPFKRARNPANGSVIALPGEVDFDPRHGHYMKLGEILVTLASASLVFIPTPLSTSHLPALGFCMMILGMTVVYSLGFMAAITYFYEMFLFDPASFTALKSCLMFSLGFGTLFCFAVAYLVLAFDVGIALVNGTLAVSCH
jgi:hypothetical protein